MGTRNFWKRGLEYLKYSKKKDWGTEEFPKKGRKSDKKRKIVFKTDKNLDAVPQGTRAFLGSGGTTPRGY